MLIPSYTVGCYDGCVYVLNSISGNIEWCCKTDGSMSNDPIKSSPIVHPSTGQVWFGSHDKQVYCIDINVSHSLLMAYNTGTIGYITHLSLIMID